MKSILDILLKIYLYPLTQSVRLKRYILDTYFTDPSHHLHQLIRIIQTGRYSKNDIIIDIGAADGSVSAFFAKQFPEHSIFSFEPNPDWQSSLEKKSKHNPQIHIRNIALTRMQGEMPFYITINSVSSSLKKINKPLLELQKHPHLKILGLQKEVLVKTNTLDNEFRDYEGDVLLIKLDTQGAELDILSGGSKTLARTRYVLTEMQNHGFYIDAAPYYAVDSYLREKGFVLVDLIPSTRRNGIWLHEFDAIYRNASLVPE